MKCRVRGAYPAKKKEDWGEPEIMILVILTIFFSQCSNDYTENATFVFGTEIFDMYSLVLHYRVFHLCQVHEVVVVSVHELLRKQNVQIH